MLASYATKRCQCQRIICPWRAMDTFAPSIDRPPATRPRPKLARWLLERRISSTAAGTRIGVSREMVRRYCLPFDDPAQAVPGPGPLARIVEWTAGEITAADFYPPHLNGAAEPLAEGLAS